MIYRIYYGVKDGTGDYELIQMPVGTAGVEGEEALEEWIAHEVYVCRRAEVRKLLKDALEALDSRQSIRSRLLEEANDG